MTHRTLASTLLLAATTMGSDACSSMPAARSPGRSKMWTGHARPSGLTTVKAYGQFVPVLTAPKSTNSCSPGRVSTRARASGPGSSAIGGWEAGLGRGEVVSRGSERREGSTCGACSSWVFHTKIDWDRQCRILFKGRHGTMQLFFTNPLPLFPKPATFFLENRVSHYPPLGGEGSQNPVSHQSGGALQDPKEN